MDTINTKTVIYIFNEEGIIAPNQLEDFCWSFANNTALNLIPQTIDKESYVYKLFSNRFLNFIIYDHGYVMKMVGEVKQAIYLLKELDEVIEDGISFYLSATQRISNSESCRFPRGTNVKGIAQFLDELFNNNDYTQFLDELP